MRSRSRWVGNVRESRGSALARRDICCQEVSASQHYFVQKAVCESLQTEQWPAHDAQARGRR